LFGGIEASCYAEKWGTYAPPDRLWQLRTCGWGWFQGKTGLRINSHERILGLNGRDWCNLWTSRYVSPLDPILTRSRPYHLVQYPPLLRRRLPRASLARRAQISVLLTSALACLPCRPIRPGACVTLGSDGEYPASFDEEAAVAIVPQQVQSGIRLLDDDEARQQFDHQAQRLMGMSGDEFLRRYEAGELDDVQDDRQQSAVMKLAMLADLVR
jgi:hypothetical protein